MAAEDMEVLLDVVAEDTEVLLDVAAEDTEVLLDVVAEDAEVLRVVAVEEGVPDPQVAGEGCWEWDTDHGCFVLARAGEHEAVAEEEGEVSLGAEEEEEEGEGESFVSVAEGVGKDDAGESERDPSAVVAGDAVRTAVGGSTGAQKAGTALRSSPEASAPREGCD